MDFGGFVLQKTEFLDLHQEKVLQYTQFKMYSSLKTHILTKSTNFLREKNLEMKEYIFLLGGRKKIIKHFAKKVFVCLKNITPAAKLPK